MRYEYLDRGHLEGQRGAEDGADEIRGEQKGENNFMEGD